MISPTHTHPKSCNAMERFCQGGIQPSFLFSNPLLWQYKCNKGEEWSEGSESSHRAELHTRPLGVMMCLVWDWHVALPNPVAYKTPYNFHPCKRYHLVQCSVFRWSLHSGWTLTRLSEWFLADRRIPEWGRGICLARGVCHGGWGFKKELWWNSVAVSMGEVGMFRSRKKEKPF